MRKIFTLTLIVGLFYASSNILSANAIDCGTTPSNCNECLQLCTSCDQPNTWTCDEASAANDNTHPCNLYCN